MKREVRRRGCWWVRSRRVVDLGGGTDQTRSLSLAQLAEFLGQDKGDVQGVVDAWLGLPSAKELGQVYDGMAFSELSLICTHLGAIPHRL